MSDNDNTPTSQRTLPVELSMAVLDRLNSLETLTKTSVNTSAKVLDLTSELCKDFRELLDSMNTLSERMHKAEERLDSFPCQRPMN
jgi:hypothetical protein